ncbi:4Fe-4S cluster-binding domain-containing protein [Streptomyces sp. NPDC008150]|uniref:4Fe-4S single cluster domain-containing protein n=1 Tax=Streptomyces sp. NPDC008150 TaxID=3364816 RepID=UPI0036E6FB12
MTRLAVSRLHHPVTVLGHGVRAGVWVQGCSLACPGCMSRDTWEARPETEADVSAVLDWIRGLPGPLDGVTVSGGEPFEQPEALAELLHGIRELLDDGTSGQDNDADILVFSGLAWPRLRDGAGHSAALASCDAIVAGPYVARRNTGSPLRGSDNQRIVPLTPLGRERYGPLALAGYGERRLQLTSDGTDLRLIGIPHRADLARLRDAAEAGGVTWEGTTWSA